MKKNKKLFTALFLMALFFCLSGQTAFAFSESDAQAQVDRYQGQWQKGVLWHRFLHLDAWRMTWFPKRARRIPPTSVSVLPSRPEKDSSSITRSGHGRMKYPALYSLV